MNIITITELPSFAKKAKKIFSEQELSDLKNFLIENPDKGDVIPATGWLRKLRWSAGGKGKRGGSRVIYFYHVVGYEVYLFTCYKKNKQENITQQEKKELSNLVKILKERV